MNAIRAAVPTQKRPRTARAGRTPRAERRVSLGCRRALSPCPCPPRPRLLHVFQTLPGMLAVMVVLVAGAIGSPRCGRGGDPNTRRVSERDARFPVRPGDDGILEPNVLQAASLPSTCP